MSSALERHIPCGCAATGCMHTFRLRLLLFGRFRIGIEPSAALLPTVSSRRPVSTKLLHVSSVALFPPPMVVRIRPVRDIVGVRKQLAHRRLCL